MTMTQEVRSVDRDLLVAMRSGEALGVEELTKALGVTATAIRQRIERLLGQGLVEREKVVVGRGRPTFRYRITLAGNQATGANPSELAGAMWRAILDVDDPDLRDTMLQSVAKKLGKQYADALRCLGEEDGDPSLESRLQKLSTIMTGQQIAATVSDDGVLPVLDIVACPYPSLTAASADRAMCKLEEQMLSEALGHPVQLSSCRLDGDSCCQFSAKEIATS